MEDVALGRVHTEVSRIRFLDGKAVAGWSTIVRTKGTAGFQVAGSDTFTFKDRKISSLRVVVSLQGGTERKSEARQSDCY